VRILVVEMLLAKDVLAIDPQVCRSIRSQDHRDLPGLWHIYLGVGPRTEIVAGVVKGGHIDQVVVSAAKVPPGEFLITNLKGSSLDRLLVDLGQLVIVVLGDVKLVVWALELVKVKDWCGMWTGHQPVVDGPLVELVLEIVLWHMVHFLLLM